MVGRPWTPNRFASPWLWPGDALCMALGVQNCRWATGYEGVIISVSTGGTSAA